MTPVAASRASFEAGVRLRALIQINERSGRVRAKLRILLLKDAAMPLDSILVSLAVVAMFVAFAGALWWGDTQA